MQAGDAGSQGVAAAGESFKAGLQAVQAHHLPLAERAFARVVRLAPGVAAGHSALGAVLVQEGKFAAAVPELETALRLDSNDATAKLNVGLAYASSPGLTAETAGRGVAALEGWRQGTGSALPPDAAVAMAKLEIAAGQGSAAGQDAALATLEEALRSSPENAVLLDTSGVLLAQGGRFGEAQQRFTQALRWTPEPDVDRRGEIELHLGSAMLALGDAAGAMRELATAVRLRPGDTAARVQLGVAQFSAGQEPAGIATLREALRRDPASAEAAYRLALSLESSGHSDEALPMFARVRKERPRDAEVLTNYGLALVEMGKAKEAVPLYLEAVQIDGGSATLHQDLGVAYLQQNDLDGAIAEFRRGMDLDSASAQIAYDLGLALKLKDRLPEAITAFERARTLDPTLADAPFTLGALYMQQGRFTEAAGSLREAVQLRAENADAWAMLGSVLKQDAKPKEAAEALRRAITLDPGQPGNHVNLASVLVELGQKDEAVRERKTAAELSRAATTKQKERFALDSGRLLQGRGQFAEAIVQFRSAVAADPGDAAAHLALAEVLAQTGAKVEAEAERGKAAALGSLVK